MTSRKDKNMKERMDFELYVHIMNRDEQRAIITR